METLIYSAQEDPALYEQEQKKKKDDSRVVDDADHEPPVRLYKINVKDRKITRLTTNTDWIEDFDLSHDGKYAVAPLPYAFDALEPAIDARTVEFHYSFHHKPAVAAASPRGLFRCP